MINVNSSLIKPARQFAWSTGLPSNQLERASWTPQCCFILETVSSSFKAWSTIKSFNSNSCWRERMLKRKKDKVCSDALDLGGHSRGLQLGQWRLVTAHRLSSWDRCPWRSGTAEIYRPISHAWAHSWGVADSVTVQSSGHEEGRGGQVLSLTLSLSWCGSQSLSEWYRYGSNLYQILRRGWLQTTSHQVVEIVQIKYCSMHTVYCIKLPVLDAYEMNLSSYYSSCSVALRDIAFC